MSSTSTSFPEQACLDALARPGLPDLLPDEAFGRLTRLAAQVFAAPVSLIMLASGQEPQLASRYGPALGGLPTSLARGTFAAGPDRPGQVLSIPDTALDARWRGEGPVAGQPRPRFYAGAPLRTPGGQVVGSLCVLDTQPRSPLSPAEEATLEGLAAVVMDAVVQRVSGLALQQMQAQLARKRQHIDLILAKTGTALWSLDFASGAVEVQADLSAQGLPEEYAPTTVQALLEIVHPEDRPRAYAQMRRAAEQGTDYELQARLQLPGGLDLWTNSRGSVQRDRAGRPTRLLAVTTNIHHQRETELALAESEATLRQIIEKTEDAIYIKDVQGVYRLINPAAARMMGACPEEIVGRSDAAFADERQTERLGQIDRQVMDQARSVVYEAPLAYGQPDRTMLTSKFPFVQADEIRGVIGISRDVTVQKQLEQAMRESNVQLERKVEERTRSLEDLNRQLQHDALHDALTALPNRALFTDRLEQAIRRRENSGNNTFAVLFLDFDRFKLINDSLGHAAGDELLLGIAERLRAHVTSPHTVARLGGDEFTVLLEGLHTREEVRQQVWSIQQALAPAFQVSGQDLRVTASIGITLCDQNYSRAEDVLRDADIAMYRAKTQQKGSFAFFEPALLERQVALLNLQQDLRQAVERQEFRIHYQPILRLEDRSVVGVEALVRWQHPLHGLISPAEFIPLAEESGLICDIDLWVLRGAARQVRLWNAGRAAPLTLNVNLSAQHFEDRRVVGQVRAVLEEEQFSPTLLHLEITESLLMARQAHTVEMLGQLRALGLAVVIDDFGTGYSSLSYLQRFPLDGLKIDRSFIATAQWQPEVLRTIVQLGQHLKMYTVAEGLEDEAQAKQLRALNCEYGQGYFFARPLPAEDLGELLRLPEGPAPALTGE